MSADAWIAEGITRRRLVIMRHMLLEDFSETEILRALDSDDILSDLVAVREILRLGHVKETDS